jgi:hypothetical protein
MIIKSKYSYFMLFFSIFIILLFTGGFVYNLMRVPRFQPVLFYGIFCFLVINVMECSLLYWDTKLIKIDTHANSISFTRLFTKKEDTYLLNDIDGVLELKKAWGAGRMPHKILYIVKDNKITERISPVFIDNYEEFDTFLKFNKITRLTKDSKYWSFHFKELFGKPSITRTSS